MKEEPSSSREVINQSSYIDESSYKSSLSKRRYFLSSTSTLFNIFFIIFTILSGSFIFFYFQLKKLNKENTELENIFNKKPYPLSSKKIVACVLQKDNKYFPISMKYLERLKEEKKISEIHIWSFVNVIKERDENAKNYDYIANCHRTGNGTETKFREIFPEIEDKSTFKISIKAKSDAYILINSLFLIKIGENKNQLLTVSNILTKEVYGSIGGQSFLDEKDYLLYLIEVKNGKISIKKNYESLLETKIYDNMTSIQDNVNQINSIKIKSGPNQTALWEYGEVRNNGIKIYESTLKDKFEKEIYPYYIDYDFDVFLKIDGDIVYIDINKFDEYIYFILENEKKENISFVFPQIINHPVGVFYEIKLGLIPESLFPYYYFNKTYSNEIYAYNTDGNTAKLVHDYFLKNIKNFTENLYFYGEINIDGELVNNNFYGIKRDKFVEIFGDKSKDKKFMGTFYDIVTRTFERAEEYIWNQDNLALYPRFVVSKYAFNGQKPNLGDDFLDDYSNLAENVLYNKNLTIRNNNSN